MKKRWIALVLALCMVWTLSACTGETPSRKPIQEDGAQEDQQDRNTAGEKEEEKEEQTTSAVSAQRLRAGRSKNRNNKPGKPEAYSVS